MKDQLSNKQIARLARRAARLLGYAEALTSELPSELGTSIAEHFAASSMEYIADALADIAKIKRSLHLARIRERPSLREELKRAAENRWAPVTVHVPLPVHPYSPTTALVVRKERAA